MDNAPDVMSGGMDRAMDHITSLGDPIGQVRLLYDSALEIDGIQVRGTDFAVVKSQSVNENSFSLPGT
jgi:hypothetical protein